MTALLPFSVTFFFIIFIKLASASEVVYVEGRQSNEFSSYRSTDKIVVNADEFYSKDGGSLLKTLDRISGFSAAKQGGAGKTTSVFTRGMNSEHTLVLINGVEVNDTISPSRAYDFAFLDFLNIEKVIFIKGPRSVEFGSDAIGGVINIITQGGRSNTHRATGYLGVGHFGRVLAGSSYGRRGARYTQVTNLHFNSSAGLSVASPRVGGGEKDGVKNFRLDTKLSYRWSPFFDGEFFIWGAQSENDLDNIGFANVDDPNFIEKGQRLYSSLKINLNPTDKRQKHQIFLNWASNKRNLNNRSDLSDPTDSASFFRGRHMQGGWRSTFRWGQSSELKFGLDLEQEKGSSTFFSDNKASTYASFFQWEWANNNWLINSGVRWDRLAKEKLNVFTFRVAPSYQFTSLGSTVFLSFGSGYKKPSLFQLLDPMFGNKDLESEEALSFDGGVKLKNPWIGGFTSLTLFQTEVENLISFAPVTFRATNLEKAKVQGVELLSEWVFSNSHSLALGYDHFFKIQNLSNDKKLYRRPDKKFYLSWQYETGPWSIKPSLVYTGSRLDIDALSFSDKNLKGYSLVSLLVGYKPSPRFSFQLDLENLTNRKYENIDGFSRPGFNSFLRINYQLGSY